MDFTEFNLHEDLLKGIAAAGYVACTPVQEEVLKAALDGSDLYVQSQTGTGKTAAYLVTIVQELLTNEKNAGKKTLVLLPTRELAVQDLAMVVNYNVPNEAENYVHRIGRTARAGKSRVPHPWQGR